MGFNLQAAKEKRAFG
jgi:hypothetical protein